MALDNYFAALKLSTGASDFIAVEDRAVRTTKQEEKMQQTLQPHSNGSTREASAKFSAIRCDQPLSCPMRASPSIEESDPSFTLVDGSFRFTDKASSRWSPPSSSSLRKHMGHQQLQSTKVSGGSPPQSRRPIFNAASRST